VTTCKCDVITSHSVYCYSHSFHDRATTLALW